MFCLFFNYIPSTRTSGSSDPARSRGSCPRPRAGAASWSAPEPGWTPGATAREVKRHPARDVTLNRPCTLQTCLGRKPTRLHGPGQGFVVLLVLVGVGEGELRDRGVKRVALAQVGRDRDPVPPTGRAHG